MKARISPRTGRPVRRYDDVISTTVKALDFDARAIRKLVTKWPAGAICGNKLEPWPRHLSIILVQVLCDCGFPEPMLGYTPPELRGPQTRSNRNGRSLVMLSPPQNTPAVTLEFPTFSATNPKATNQPT